MILDKENLLSEDQQITSSDSASTNVIDLGDDDSAAPSPNEKGDIEILCQVTDTFEGGTSIAVSVQTDDDEAFGSATTIITTAAIATATLVEGYQFKVAVPRSAISERYLRLYYDVEGTMTAGKITAGIILDNQTSG